VIFDFETLPQRGLVETIRVLADLYRFVIADITEPRSVPHELATIITKRGCCLVLDGAHLSTSLPSVVVSLKLSAYPWPIVSSSV
jgi:hypothetical protein